jgi:hypothetical protein
MSQVLPIIPTILIKYILPCAAGLGLAALGFLRKYPTEVKYVYRSLPTWFYLLLTTGGSLLFTVAIEAIGVRVVGIDWVNTICLGIIGPAVFLGVISRLPPPLSSSHGVDQQLKTLRDFAFDTLGKSISRKTTQIVALKIHDAGRDIDLNSFLREVEDMLKDDTAVPLKAAQKRKLRVEFDRWAMNGEYASIIRELKKYYDVDHIIQRLSPEYKRKRMRTRLGALMREAVDPHRPRDGVSPEWVFAKVQALRKNPDDTLYYLEKALQKKPSLKDQILTDEIDWWILTSMTPGENQQAKLAELLRLIGIEHLFSLEDIEQQCMDQDRLSITFMAVKRSNGDCVKITLSRRSIQDNQADSVRWWIMSEWDMHLNKECADFNEVKSHIQQVIIPIRQV